MPTALNYHALHRTTQAFVDQDALDRIAESTFLSASSGSVHSGVVISPVDINLEPYIMLTGTASQKALFRFAENF